MTPKKDENPAPTHTVVAGCAAETVAPSTICATNIACPTQAPWCPPIGYTGWHTCGQPNTGTGPAAAPAGGPVGPTGWYTCGQQTHLLGCTTATSTPTT